MIRWQSTILSKPELPVKQYLGFIVGLLTIFAFCVANRHGRRCGLGRYPELIFIDLALSGVLDTVALPFTVFGQMWTGSIPVQ